MRILSTCELGCISGAGNDGKDAFYDLAKQVGAVRNAIIVSTTTAGWAAAGTTALFGLFGAKEAVSTKYSTYAFYGVPSLIAATAIYNSSSAREGLGWFANEYFGPVCDLFL